MIAAELGRAVRHLVAPLVTWLVSHGVLPEYAQSDLTEGLAIALAFGIAYGWSRYHERVAKDSEK